VQKAAFLEFSSHRKTQGRASVSISRLDASPRGLAADARRATPAAGAADTTPPPAARRGCCRCS
jgi:hypothetical protein